jgi:hypothetical protein
MRQISLQPQAKRANPMLSQPMRHKSATRAVPGVAAGVICLAVGLGLALGAASRPVQAAGPAPNNCISQLQSGSGPVVCSYPTQLGERERSELRRLTGDLVTDARCMVHVRIERRQIAAALLKPDNVFQPGPQNVTCELITSDEKLPITATFAPSITIKSGRAVDAHPGMSNLTGLNEYVANPVLTFVNQSDMVRGQMVRIVNLYLANQQIGAQVQQGSRS